MSAQNTSASIDLNRQLLYYTIRLQNSDDTLHAWMRHILAYLTSASEELQPARGGQQQQLQQQQQEQQQEPHLAQNESCDGSCDCQTNSWVRELSYEQHCRKLLMSRVNAGDTNLSSSVDEDSLRREASLVMESVNRVANDDSDDGESDGADDNLRMLMAEEPMDVDAASSYCFVPSSDSSDWDFVVYDSDVESDEEDDVDSVDDPTYKACDSDLLKLDSEYTSDDEDEDDDFDVDVEVTDLDQDEEDIQVEEEEEEEEDEEDEDVGQSEEVDNLSSYTYDVRISTSLRLDAAGNTEKRTVKFSRSSCRRYNACSNGNGNKIRVCRSGCIRERVAGTTNVASGADNSCEVLYYDDNSSENDDEAKAADDDGEYFDSECKQQSSRNY